MSGTATCSAATIAVSIVALLGGHIAALDRWSKTVCERTTRPDPRAVLIMERIARWCANSTPAGSQSFADLAGRSRWAFDTTDTLPDSPDFVLALDAPDGGCVRADVWMSDDADQAAGVIRIAPDNTLYPLTAGELDALRDTAAHSSATDATLTE